MADTTQQSALRNLAAQMPVANQRVAAGQQAARDLQLQAAVQKVAPAQATIQNAQQTGAALAQQAGQEQVQRVQSAAQGQDQIQQLGQQVQALETQKNLVGLEAGLKEQQMSDAQKFASVSEAAKKEMFDSRMDFEKDEMGRKFSNERQLADYARLRAHSEDEWQNYVQRTDQMYQRKEQFLTAAHQKLVQEIQLQNAQMDQLRDQMSKKAMSSREFTAKQEILKQRQAKLLELQAAEAYLIGAKQREEARRRNTMAKNGALGSILGAGIGAALGTMAGNPAMGAAAGAGIGSSIGGAVGTLASL